VDAAPAVTGHNDGVAGRTGRLVAFFTRADPREAASSGWALAFDAAVALGAAIGAVYEVGNRAVTVAGFFNPGGRPVTSIGPAPVRIRDIGGMIVTQPVTVHAPALALVAAALTALPLAARRICPIGVWLTIAAAIVVVHRTSVPPVALGTAVYAAYSAITYSRYRNLAIAVVGVTTLAVAGALGNDLPRFPGRLTAVFAIVPAAVAGLGIRVLRHRLADSTARLRRAADEARVATERALAAERARIASELHDVVTHNVSVMIVQAGAARKIMASSPADAEDALLAVEATGRDAMTELRNLLGLLSPAQDEVRGTGSAGAGSAGARAPGPAPGRAPATLRPQPGLSELGLLVERVTATGLPVELRVSGEPRPLPPGADLAAYRVVQEGLTNVLRHAGQATAAVSVRWDGQLEITVSDDGSGAGPASPGDAAGPGPGRGLLGLRERLGLYGGELTAGPHPGGGWRVRAVLPLAEAA
jgi:signal transduction histidine kinase